MEDALRTPGMQVIVYGHSGSGKSTLIQHKASKHFHKFIASPCTSSTTFQDLLIDAFDQLNQFYESEQSENETRKTNSSGKGKLGPLEVVFGTEEEKGNNTTKKRIINPVLSSRRLAEYLKQENICWIIEDFHKVDKDEKINLTDNLKVFFDLKAKIIALGAVGTARQVLEINKEMYGRVSEIRVPLMLDDELLALISKGEELLNLNIDFEVKNKIVQYSGGLASICHHLCLKLAQANQIKRTVKQSKTLTTEEFEKGIRLYLRNSSDTLKKAYDIAIRLKNDEKNPYSKEIIKSFLRMEEDEISLQKLQEHMKVWGSFSSKKKIAMYLEELASDKRENVLRYDEASNKYSINDPFFIPYAFSQLQTEMDEDEILRIRQSSAESNKGKLIDEISPKIQENS